MHRSVAAPAVGVLCLLTLLAVGIGPGPRPWRRPARVAPGSGVVDHVIDGDTVVVRLDGQVETVRLLGVDTPETVKPGTPVECFGPEASARTKGLLPPGTVVVVRRDREPRDRFGRLLAYVWRATDRRLVNLDLVAGGYARLLVLAPNGALAPRLRTAAAEARREGRGLWGACHQARRPP